MEANPVRITQYFDGEKQSIIPLFQRPYTWEKRNWSALWDDIMSYTGSEYSDASHFMGAVVSIPARTVPIGVTKHLVIDGQQRLTTIAILLCALRDSVENKLSYQIQDYLTNRHYEEQGSDYLKLLPTQGDREPYLDLVKNTSLQEKKKGMHLMHESYFFFKDAIEKAKDEDGNSIAANTIFDVVKKVLQVVMINLGESDDPYLIFESLNFKGEPLTQADLIRNYVLMRFRHSMGSGGEQEKVYLEYWRPIESAMGSELSDFLWHYISRKGNLVKKPKIYSAFKDEYKGKNEEDLLLEMQEIRRHSYYYQRFLDPVNEKNTVIRKSLQSLLAMEVSIVYPLLLRLFRAFDAGECGERNIIQFLKILESFIFRRTIIDEKRSALNKLFHRLSAKYPRNSENVEEWIKSELLETVRSERWPSNDEVIEAIVNKPLYGTKGAKILLVGVESFLSGKETVDPEKLSIEHIMPQTISEQWKESLGENWGKIHAQYQHSIGNLTLTALNPELGNKSFVEKKESFAQSNITLNRKLIENKKWDEEEILNRGKEIAEYAIKIWSRQ